VTDTTALSDSDTTSATIEAVLVAPVANPGGPYFGTTGIAVSFDGTASSDQDGTVVEWNWDFGDGSTGTGATPSHTYAAAGTFTVSLTVVDNDGLSSAPASTTATIVEQTQIPVADPNGPYTGVEGREVTFDGTGSYDPDGGSIVSYAWDFGDGNTGIGANPTNVYVAAGTYTVTLTVTDDEGEVSVPATTSAVIALDVAPTALTDGPYNGTVNVSLTMDGSTSFDPDGVIVSWDWDFGDGDTGAGETTSHAYAAEGVYTVSLTVTDDFGNNGNTTTTATITAPALLPPVADAGGPYSGLVNEAVAFNGTASTDPDGTIVRYDWDFGDGTVLTDAGPTPTHTYTTADTYNVVLTVTDNDGLSDSDSATATITEPTGDGDAFLTFMNAPNSPSTNVGKVLNRIVRVYGDATILEDTTVTLAVDAPAGVLVQYSPESITAIAEPGRPLTHYFFDVSLECAAAGTYAIKWTATIDAAANSDPANDTQEDVTTLTCNN
jgi:PKD repeat protein